jgi:hypothetical protein
LMEQLSMDREMKRRQDAQKVNKRGGKIWIVVINTPL